MIGLFLSILHFLVSLPSRLWSGLLELWSSMREEMFPKVIAEIAVAILGAVVLWSEERLKRNWRKFLVRVRQFFSRKRLILLWIDGDLATVHRVANRLKIYSPFLRILPLGAPADLLFYPAKRKVVAAVILISTDVTKLSSDDKVREKIEESLEKYVLRGGGLVAGHDIIYRRTRNPRLSRAFGGTIQHWDSKTTVQYEKSAAEANHPIARRLPDRFSLEDGEVLCVDWTGGAHVLFHEAGANPARGLVMARDYGKGRLVWINSCDHQTEIANSIGAPNDDFVRLLSASAQWAANQPQLAQGAPLIAAHRGVQPFGGENTLRAFGMAIEFGADFIECDIRRTKDGVLVLHHDPTIGGYRIADKTFAELAPASAAAGRPLARLEELLAIAKGHIGLDFELKETGYEQEIAAMIQSITFDPDKFVVTSFLEPALQRFKECYPQARCGLLLEYRRWPFNRYPLRRLRRIGANFIAPNDRLVTSRFARRLAKKDYPLWVWTVNDQVRVAELLRTPGIEAVITDYVNASKREQARAREA
jgi:glycerophosphoryl diester phosphodiesterase